MSLADRPLRHHDRSDYSPIHARSDDRWPDGHRLAVYLGFNLDLPAVFVARGDEIIGHGYTNAERQGTMPEDEERALPLDCARRIERESGRRRLVDDARRDLRARVGDRCRA